jgi:hypothetical protein
MSTGEHEGESVNANVNPATGISLAGWRWYIVGMIGLALGAGFYGILSCLLLIAWALHAPNAPTRIEGCATLGAASAHLTLLLLWLIYRSSLSRQSVSIKRGLATVAWLLIPISLAVMFAMLGI